MKTGFGLPVFPGVAIGPAVVCRKTERALPVSSGDPKVEQAKFDALPPEYSHLYLAVGGELTAVICISDPLRSEAHEVIQAPA